MNIHFDDKELFYRLKSFTLARVRVGSHMYNMDNDLSDIDYLHIYTEPQQNRESFMWEHHQLQYIGSDGVDHNFTTLQNFIRNAMTGDSPINTEVIFSGALIGTDLHWLYDRRNWFINYSIIKGYLGLARRDFKEFCKKTNINNKRGISTFDVVSDKKLAHVVRSVIFAKMLMGGSFDPKMDATVTYSKFGPDCEFLNKIKNSVDSGFNSVPYDDIIEFFGAEFEQLRSDINARYERNQIQKYMYPINLEYLDFSVRNTIDKFREMYPVVGELDYKHMFYNALEHGVKY